MIFKCNHCYKKDPCILEFKELGEFLPEWCPFEKEKNQIAEWKEIKKEKNKEV